MMYRVTVGDRSFADCDTKQKAIDLAKTCSKVYQTKECKVVHKNMNQVKGTATYLNGEEI